MDSIGVRELRQHASRYLARVEAGESLQITDRGHPVAHLVPPVRDPWEDLIATGRVLRPEDDGHLLDIEALDAPAHGPSSSERLAATREHER